MARIWELDHPVGGEALSLVGLCGTGWHKVACGDLRGSTYRKNHAGWHDVQHALKKYGQRSHNKDNAVG